MVDGSKRTAWASAWTFLYADGMELDPGFDVDDAEELMNDVATLISNCRSMLCGYAATLPGLSDRYVR